MNNWKYKLIRFMQGRYGMDALYKALLGLMLLFFVLNLFFQSILLYLLSLLAGGLAVYRSFSKNTALRSQENQKYLAFRDKVKKQWLQLVNRVKHYRTHRYRACPSCKTTLRLPKKLGVNQVTCPVCKHAFEVNIRH